MDAISVLKDLREVVWKDIQSGTGTFAKQGELLQEIDEALADPTIEIDIPGGKLCASVSLNEAVQLSSYIKTDSGMDIDMFLAEVPKDTLLDVYKEKEGLNEGDVRMLVWSDIGDEFYTHNFTIKAKDIEEINEPDKERD